MSDQRMDTRSNRGLVCCLCCLSIGQVVWCGAFTGRNLWRYGAFCVDCPTQGTGSQAVGAQAKKGTQAGKDASGDDDAGAARKGAANGTVGNTSDGSAGGEDGDEVCVWGRGGACYGVPRGVG